MDELNAIISLWGKSCIKNDNGVVTIEGRAVTSRESTQIDAELIRLQAEYDALEYARNRKAEYDALNQFELISDDANNGTTTHKDAVNAIKTKYPKP